MLRTSAALFLSLSALPAAAAQHERGPDDPRFVAIVLYPGVELLDFAGPGEVFAATHHFQAHTVATTRAPLASQSFVTITPEFSIDDCPHPDVVVVPGGNVPLQDERLHAWIAARGKDSEVVMSVCNGALLLARAGLLAGLEVTTHASSLEQLALLEPQAAVLTNRRFVDSGRIVTCAGVSAGIDGALQVAARLGGEEEAWRIARYMEYDWRPDELARLHQTPPRPVENAEAFAWIASLEKLGLERALGEYRAQATPPSAAQMNRWAYLMLSGGRTSDALALFELVYAAFPDSANAADSFSEALEKKGDPTRAVTIAEECLARLGNDASIDEGTRKILRNAAASRVARLTGKGASLEYVCAPCGGSCDQLAYLEAGRCPGCPMQLERRAAGSTAAGR